MKIVVLGASGKTGRELVQQATAAGHSVTAFVRDPAKLGGAAASNVVVGDARIPADLARALQGADAVIGALGAKPSDPVLEKSVRALLETMPRAGVRRLVLLSSFLASPEYAPSGVDKLMGRLMKGMMADKVASEALLMGSDLDWTIVYAARLADGPKAGYDVVTGSIPGRARISRADVAAALLDTLSDEAAAREIRQIVGRG